METCLIADNMCLIADNMCLITGEPLDPSLDPYNTVMLKCGHKYSYDAIYNDVKYQAYDASPCMRNVWYIPYGCPVICCPYCRHIQTEMLPSHPNYETLYGVNSSNVATNPKENGKEITNGYCTYKMKEGTSCGNHWVKYHAKSIEWFCRAHYDIAEKLMCKNQKRKKQKNREPNVLTATQSGLR